METSEIQPRIDAVNELITAKGLRQAVAKFEISGHKESQCGAHWYAGASGYDYKSWWSSLGAPRDVVKELEVWAETLPTIDQRRLAEFTEQLAKTIEMGKDHGIDVQLVNPLVDAMKRLSENALEDHSR